MTVRPTDEIVEKIRQEYGINISPDQAVQHAVFARTAEAVKRWKATPARDQELALELQGILHLPVVQVPPGIEDFVGVPFDLKSCSDMVPAAALDLLGFIYRVAGGPTITINSVDEK